MFVSYEWITGPLIWDHLSVYPGVIPDYFTDHSTNTVISTAPEVWKKKESQEVDNGTFILRSLI